MKRLSRSSWVGFGLLAAGMLGQLCSSTRGQGDAATVPATAASAPTPLAFYPGMTKAVLDRLTFSAATDAGDANPGPHTPLVFPDVSIGFHINAGVYAPGAPVPAYFVVKSTQALTRGMDLRPEQFRDLSRTARSVKIKLRRMDGAAISLKGRGSPPRSAEEVSFSIPPKGMICFSGDLRTLAEDNTLPAGTYAASWNYAGMNSKEVMFEVGGEAATQAAATEGATAPATMPAGVAVLPDRSDWLDLVGTATKRRRGDAVLDWTNSVPNRMSGTQLGCALAAGIDGRFYPDVYNLPTRDDTFAMSAEFTMGAKDAPNNDDTDPRKDKTLDNIVVKLHPVAGPEVTLPRILLGSGNISVGLLLEAVGRSRVMGSNFDGEQVEEIGTESWSLEKGGTIHITLRKDWKNAMMFTGKARMAVVVLSERPWVAFQPDGQESGLPQVKAARYWKGALRSNYVMVEIKR